MKKCIDCNSEQTESNFPFDKSRNRYLSVCKKCTAIRTEAYRQKNKDKWRESSKKHADKSNSLITEWKSKGCQKCGENRIHLIDAHHIDPSIKEFSVGSAMRGLKITEEEEDMTMSYDDAYDMEEEPMGFIKFDILGIASLRMIEGAIRHVLKRHYNIKDPTFDDVKKFYNDKLHPDKMDLSDKKVYKNIFHKGNWAGIFQFTERGAQEFCKKVKPNNIIDLSAITSIYRPGPLSANVDKDYVVAKEAPQLIKYIHPIAKQVTQDTYGFLIFQEQIALLAHKLGKDLDLDEGNKLRKLLTKKGTGKGFEEKDKIHHKFVEGCVEKGIKANDAQKLWETFEYFSGYGFNKSHAVCYSILSYQCAWLATYYKAEWMASFLDKENDKDKEKAINIAKSHGFNIETLNVNTSGTEWEISEDGSTLIQPLTSIKGLGEVAIVQITNNRPFKTIEEFLFNDKMSYSKLNKKALDVLCRSGAMSCLIDKRFTGGKHFWSAVAVDRPRKQKDLDENIKITWIRYMGIEWGIK